MLQIQDTPPQVKEAHPSPVPVRPGRAEGTVGTTIHAQRGNPTHWAEAFEPSSRDRPVQRECKTPSPDLAPRHAAPRRAGSPRSIRVIRVLSRRSFLARWFNRLRRWAHASRPEPVTPRGIQMRDLL